MSEPFRLDPITKLVIGLSCLTVAACTFRLEGLLIEAFCLMVCLSVWRCLWAWLRFLKIALPTTALVFLVTALAYGLLEALNLALRLLLLFSVSFLLFQKLSSEELGSALTRLRIPSWFAFLLTIALRFVPYLGERLEHIKEAQRSRGIDLRLRLRNLPNLAALGVPLLIQSFILADDLAMALESRGYGRPGRSFRRSDRLRPWDYGVIVVVLAGLVVFIGILH